MFDQKTLANGLRIIGEKIDHFRSVAVGLWIGAGSQYETPPEAGVSHFLEHMVFKGTQKRTARQIAEEMDAVGGQLNAFTSKECTCFYAKVVDEHLDLAMDVLSDMATAPKFDPTEMEKEKGVVIEEIAMAEDTPEDVVHELIMLAQFGDQPVARPILGSERSVSSFAREDLLSYWGGMYHPRNAVLALAGNYDWERVVDAAERLLGNWGASPRAEADFHTHAVEPTALFKEKDIEQVQICLGYPGVTMEDERNYAFSLLNSVLGGSMSSRLFQKIREEKGMAYSIYSYPNSYLDCGMLSIYAATRPEQAAEVLRMIREEVASIAEKGIRPEEFQMAREQLKAGFILGSESTSARMNSLGRRLLLLNRTRTETEVIDKINAMRFEEVNALAREILTAPSALAVVGRDAEKLSRQMGTEA